MKNKLLIIIGIIILLAISALGWIFVGITSDNRLSDNEINALKISFIQTYGDNVTINQLISPDRIYAALCKDTKGNLFISWNVGGYWITVWTAK
jgi:hypothetical protein